VGAGTHLADSTGLPAVYTSSCAGWGSEAVFEFTLGGIEIKDLAVTMTPLEGDHGVVTIADAPCGGTELLCSGSPGPGAPTAVTLSDAAPGTYYIMADMWNAESGPFTLDIALIDILPAGSSCDPADPTARCETGTYCAGSPATCQAPTIILEETFDTAIPASWSVVDGGDTADTWFWCDPAGGCRGNNTGSASGGGYALVDSDVLGWGPCLHEDLVTVSLDASAFASVFLEFDSYFVVWTGSAPVETATIEVSNDGGASWNPVDQWDLGRGPGLERYDISAWAASEADVTIRFTYDDACDWGYYWMVDDVRILGL
jgi:hypothetical protein